MLATGTLMIFTVPGKTKNKVSVSFWFLKNKKCVTRFGFILM